MFKVIKKSKKVRIIQIIVFKEVISGLGNDSNIYQWDYSRGEWYLYKSEMPNLETKIIDDYKIVYN